MTKECGEILEIFFTDSHSHSFEQVSSDKKLKINEVTEVIVNHDPGLGVASFSPAAIYKYPRSEENYRGRNFCE